MKLLEVLQGNISDVDLSRVQAGMDAQKDVISVVKQELMKRGFDPGRVTHYARRSQKGNDVVIKYEGGNLSIESKNRDVASRPIIIAQQRVNRGDIGDMLAEYLPAFGFPANVTKFVDMLRKKNKKVGFSKDPGVRGALQRITTEDGAALAHIRSVYLASLAERGDNYVAITTGDKDVQLYFTGVGKNVLKKPQLPEFKRAMIDTTGSANPNQNQIRLGIKVIV